MMDWAGCGHSHVKFYGNIPALCLGTEKNEKSQDS